MKTFGKIAVIVGGYLAAWLIAGIAVSIHQARTAIDSVGADGMYAFGDMLLFLMVFGFVALIPTGAAIYFIRTRKSAKGTGAMKSD